jgi:acetylserotonin N-methyltransferase
MHGFGLLSSPRVIQAFDLARFRRMTDLGGGTGHLAIAACEANPELRSVVFDLAQVKDVAGRYIGASAVASRVQFMPGDFFLDPLPGSDLFALGRILHDWSDDKVVRLLARVFEHLPSGGAILIAEKLLNEGKIGPLPAQLQSLNMLVCTEGRERSLSEYRQLLENAGFSQVEGKVTGAPLDAIFARKP